jgi:magnesium transporter
VGAMSNKSQRSFIFPPSRPENPTVSTPISRAVFNAEIILGELKLKNWWYVMRKEIFSGLVLGSILATIGLLKIIIWQKFGVSDYGEFWIWIGITVSVAVVFVVLWGTLAGSMIPLVLKRFGFDPAAASAPFVATLVDVTGLIMYLSIAVLLLTGKLL